MEILCFVETDMSFPYFYFSYFIISNLQQQLEKHMQDFTGCCHILSVDAFVVNIDLLEFGPVNSNFCNNVNGVIQYHTHTHPFNGPLSRTTRVSQYQKGKTNLDFTEARDSECQWHQLGHMQVCTARQITTPTPHHSVFYRPNALPATQPTASKH